MRDSDDGAVSDSDGADMPASAMAGARGSAQATKQFAVSFTNPVVNRFLEPELTDRRAVDPVSARFGYMHDAFTNLTWSNSSDTILYTDAMEDQQRKFKRHPKTRKKSHVHVDSEENVHVHFQCKHGTVLISGLRDCTFQPICYNAKCIENGRSWLEDEGLVDPLQRGAKQTNQVEQPDVSTLAATRKEGNVAATEEASRRAQALHRCATLHKCKGNCEDPTEQPH